MISLLRTHNLTFYRHSEGYMNGLDWVEASNPTSIPNVYGSLQPYKEGKTSMLLPSGSRTRDSKLFYSTTLLQVTDEFTDTLGDYTTIAGRQYQVFNFEDWTGFGLSTDHYKYLLIAVDLNTQGDAP